ncbi:MAG: aminodeoxychorismate/anthranilate synthase component II [Candidatus Micrarchaeota archaeon]
MKLLLIDNFDSFVYNIYQYLGELGHSVDVVRNNAITIEQIRAANYDAIILSPGPGDPTNERDFGVCGKVIGEFADMESRTPILGVCLGHQGIISVFGGKIIRAEKPMHGKTSEIKHNANGLFEGIVSPLKVMRYHSLVGDNDSFPNCLSITARSTDDNAIMAIKHKTIPIFGVQFHPESIMTDEGKKILENFCNIAEARARGGGIDG